MADENTDPDAFVLSTYIPAPPFNKWNYKILENIGIKKNYADDEFWVDNEIPFEETLVKDVTVEINKTLSSMKLINESGVVKVIDALLRAILPVSTIYSFNDYRKLILAEKNNKKF